MVLCLSLSLKLLKKHPELSRKYPDIASADHVKNQQYIKDFLTRNHNAQNEIANAHWRRLGQRFDNDENRMAYAWFNGISNAMRASPEDIQNHKYVKKYNMYKKMLDLERAPASEKTHKAEKEHGITGFAASHDFDKNIGKLLNSYIAKGEMHDLTNVGHFTHSSIVVGNDGNEWLIKVEPTNAPAVKSARNGLQTTKEAAFHDAATKVFGLEGFFPRVVLGEIEKHGEKWPAAAIKMYDDSYIPASKLYKENKQALFHVLYPLLKSGELHKIGAAFYILGEADAHGQNILTNGKEMKLIDHGTSFADGSFKPESDDNVFIPYFFRAGRVRDRMDGQEKYENMPEVRDARVNADLRHWILSIDPAELHSILESYGIDSGPSIKRLEMVKKMAEHTTEMDDLINRLWTVGPGEEE